MNPNTNVTAAPSVAAPTATTATPAAPAPVASPNQPVARPQKGFGKKAKFGGNAPKL